MMHSLLLFASSALLLFSGCSEFYTSKERELKLCYQEPAKEWFEAIPIGNG